MKFKSKKCYYNMKNKNGAELVVGNHYILDKNFNNSSEVELVAVYGEHFCRVKSPEDNVEWDTMCNRLFNLDGK